MSHITLNAVLRAKSGKKANQGLRDQGLVPGVCYGNGKDPVNVAVPVRPVVELLNGPYGKNSVLNLQVEGETGTRLVIIKDYQVHPWKRKLTHVDLWEIAPERKIVLSVPFRRVNVAPAEKRGAKVQVHRDYVKVRCTAANVPKAIEFDMSTLEGDFVEVHISEVPMPEGAEVIYRQDYKVLRLKLSANVGSDSESEDEEPPAES